MLDVCLLGTGGTMPRKDRWLTAAIMKLNGKSLLIDSGEGTQIAMKFAGFTFKPLDILCITHFHADHLCGLPGLLLSMGNEGREEPLTIIGPRGVERVVNSLRVIAPGLPFEIKFIEVDKSEITVELSGFVITAFRVKHAIECVGYRVEVKRAGKFDVEKARINEVPQCIWNTLQKQGETEYEGKSYTPDMVLGEARKGIKVIYTTDTRPTPAIVANAEGADLFICEGMYGDTEKQERAEETGHMMFNEAAQLAVQAGVKELWLTHYSPSLDNPEEYLSQVQEIFENTRVCHDGERTLICFED